jgi:hypothetical protein
MADVVPKKKGDQANGVDVRRRHGRRPDLTYVLGQLLGVRSS